MYIKYPLTTLSVVRNLKNRSSNYYDLLSQDSDISLDMAHYLSDVALKSHLRAELKEKVANRKGYRFLWFL